MPLPTIVVQRIYSKAKEATRRRETYPQYSA